MKSKHNSVTELRHNTLYLEWFLDRAVRILQKWMKKGPLRYPSDLDSLFPSIKVCHDFARTVAQQLREAEKEMMEEPPNSIMALLRTIYLELNMKHVVTVIIAKPPEYPADQAIFDMIRNLDLSSFDSHKLAIECNKILPNPTHDVVTVAFFVRAVNILLSLMNDTLQFAKGPGDLPFPPAETTLVRQIEFQPEYYQSGMSILTYFGTVIRKKYPNKNIKVRIEQAGLSVKMAIETSEGDKEEIERTLEKYGMVVMGRMSPEAFFPDKADALELKQQLSLAKVQLETQRELLALKSDMLRRTDERLNFVESQYKQLTEIVGTSLRMAETATSRLAALAEQAINGNNASLAEALTLLKRTIESGAVPADEKPLRNALATIKAEPGVFSQVYDLLIKGSVSGAAGNALYAFIMNLVSMAPK